MAVLHEIQTDGTQLWFNNNKNGFIIYIPERKRSMRSFQYHYKEFKGSARSIEVLEEKLKAEPAPRWMLRLLMRVKKDLEDKGE